MTDGELNIFFRIFVGGYSWAGSKGYQRKVVIFWTTETFPLFLLITFISNTEDIFNRECWVLFLYTVLIVVMCTAMRSENEYFKHKERKYFCGWTRWITASQWILIWMIDCWWWHQKDGKCGWIKWKWNC